MGTEYRYWILTFDPQNQGTGIWGLNTVTEWTLGSRPARNRSSSDSTLCIRSQAIECSEQAYEVKEN